MWIDAHTHLTEAEQASLLALPGDFRLLVNAETKAQAEHLLAIDDPRLLISVGLHPWRADQPLEPLLTEMARADAVGEIGMDAVWCSVPLRRQRAVFARQLERAAQLKKPVVLHLKGCEGECLSLVADFPGRKLVHWYSSPFFLEDYQALGCFFTVGPDLADETVRRVATETPIDRLLLESDGVDAITWATGEEVAIADLPHWMEGHLAGVAALRGLTPAALAAQLGKNLAAFLGAPGVSR